MGKWDFLAPYDAQVQSALVAGEIQQAFESLFQGYQSVVVQFCTTLVGNTADGEDIAMEVFAAILRRLPHYEPKALLRTWIFTIARKRCSSSRSKVWHWLQLFGAHGKDIVATSVSDAPLTPAAQHEAQAEHTHWQDQLRRLQGGLSRLRARDRELLMMRYYEELSFRAMATQLRLPEANVRRAVGKAEARLLKLMTQEEAV